MISTFCKKLELPQAHELKHWISYKDKDLVNTLVDPDEVASVSLLIIFNQITD